MAEDKKTNRGGARKGAGRKPKAEEDRVKNLAIGGLTKVFGSEEKAWEHITKQAKESFPYLKLLIEYGYGKPKETKHLTHDFNSEPTFDSINIEVK